MKKANGAYRHLSSYDYYGVPLALELRDNVSQSLLAAINASLPEGKKVQDVHPEYISESTKPNLTLKKEAEVWLTFVHEGAGYKNAVGYYTYPVGQEPTSVDEIEDYFIAFQNTSFPNGGGNLKTGDKIQLKYWNKETGEFQKKFPANTVVAWFLVADGWNQNSKTVNTSKRTVYSTPHFNVESTSEKRRHNVLLYDRRRELLLLGFEDLHRENGSDDDFNDVILYTKVVPFDAVDDGDMEDPDDPDEDDEYESCNSGTLVYEDLWPYKGDYDFNDLVLDYKFTMWGYCNKVKRVEFKYKVRAIGASYHNGFALQLPIGPEWIQKVEGSILNKGYLDVAPNGTERGQSKAVIPVFEDAYNILPYVGGAFVNTVQTAPYSEPEWRTLTITFMQPIHLSQVGIPPYNPFLIVNTKSTNRFAEVHLPNREATDLADESLFGTGDDRTSRGRTYVSSRNLPWALHIPKGFDYPQEKVDITQAHLFFARWAESGGLEYADWYKNKPGYRNSALIYSH